jgi:hypothetical protein
VPTSPSGTLVVAPVAPLTGPAGGAIGSYVAVKVSSKWQSKIIWLSAAVLPGLTGLYTYLTSAGVVAFKHHPFVFWVAVTVLGWTVAYLRTTSNTVTA